MALGKSFCPGPSAFEGGSPYRHQRVQITRKDGKQIWVETVCTPVHDAGGRTQHILGFVHEVSGPATAGAVTYAGTETGEPESLDSILARVEREAILAALRRTEGQRSQAAKMMGISRSRLYRRMDALGISPKNV